METARQQVGQRMLRLAVVTAALIGAVAFNTYGSPEYWFSDELIWVVENMQINRTLNPGFLAYPAGMQIYVPLFAYKFLDLFVRFPEVDRPTLIVLARTVSALFFVGTVLLIERALCLLAGRSRDLLTLSFVATSCALIHHAHIATANSSLFFGIALSFYGFARFIVSRRLADYYGAAFFCGIAVGAKYTAIYLGLALPILFLWLQWPVTVVQFIRMMLLTGVASFLGVVLFNPYIVIGFDVFFRDIVMVAALEAPAFQGQGGFLANLSQCFTFFQSFFTEWGVYPVLVVVFCGALVAVRTWHLAGWRAPQDRVLLNLLVGFVITLLTTCAYFAMQLKINIPQSRYYIPLGLGFVLLFCLSHRMIEHCCVSYPNFRGFARLQLFSRMAASIVLAAGLVNGLAHVLVFPLSGRYEAQQFVNSKLQADPNEKVMRISVAGRSPVIFDRSLCAGRCTEVVVGENNKTNNFATWEDYLEFIERRIAEDKPRLLVVESISFYWTIFLPSRFWDQYHMRLQYPNPGPAVWKQMLERRGLYETRIFARFSSMKPLTAVIGNAYQLSAEGIGGEVHVFESR